MDSFLPPTLWYIVRCPLSESKDCHRFFLIALSCAAVFFLSGLVAEFCPRCGSIKDLSVLSDSDGNGHPILHRGILYDWHGYRVTDSVCVGETEQDWCRYLWGCNGIRIDKWWWRLDHPVSRPFLVQCKSSNLHVVCINITIIPINDLGNGHINWTNALLMLIHFKQRGH